VITFTPAALATLASRSPCTVSWPVLVASLHVRAPGADLGRHTVLCQADMPRTAVWRADCASTLFINAPSCTQRV
jgi:hypothetical protein